MNTVFENLFIFEMANNHQGSVEHGINIIREMGKIARKHNIKAGVKFQYRELDSFIHPDYKDKQDVKHIPRFLGTRLSDDQFLEMHKAVRAEGMLSIVTPFDEVSVQKCIDHSVDIIKVASCSAGDWPLLTEIANAEKPVIISTGGLSIAEIDNVYSFFMHKESKFALMHCLAVYPSPNENLRMNFINRMTRRYRDLPIGYSGHEAPDNLDVVRAAVAKGAKILERHVGLPTDTIKLNAYSMNPQETDTWIACALETRILCGPDENRVYTEVESESLRSLQRGVFARVPIKKDEEIKSGSVFFAMPCSKEQLTSGHFGEYSAVFTASQDYNVNEAIIEKRQNDNKPSKVRAIIHQAHGMLNEAQIELGHNFNVELSHHYGINEFHKTGALIVNVINREYCKKLVVLMPGQAHPNHYHRIKEETFQLLQGDLEVNHAGKIVNMKMGDQLLIERDDWHSFKSKGGCIFEEVSTTHHIGDSYYEDESIAKLDPMQRKTILKNW